MRRRHETENIPLTEYCRSLPTFCSQTPPTAVLREAATRSGDRESATEHTRQAQGKQPEREQAIEPDLQEQLRAARLEKEIQKALMKHHKILQRNAAHEQHQPPPPPQPKHDPTRERGMSIGF
jgi:hypothetical protein